MSAQNHSGVVAEEAIGADRERLFALASDRYPQLLELERTAGRVIPMIVLAPRLEGSIRPVSAPPQGVKRRATEDAATRNHSSGKE